MRSVQKVCSHVTWKIEAFIEEDTKYKKHCTQDNDASVPFKVGTLGPHRVLPIAISCPSYFPEPHQRSEISSLSKVVLVLGKTRSCTVPNLCFRGAKSPGWFDVLPKNSAWDVMHGQAHCHDEAANRQLPIGADFWIIQMVSTEECSSLMQNLMQICCSSCSVILNVTATQYTCSLNGIYHFHCLVQWSRHCSCMYIPGHSPWLPGYIYVTQTVHCYINNGWTFSG